MKSELEETIDLLQEYVIRLQATTPITPVVSLLMETNETLHVNKKQIGEEKKRNKNIMKNLIYFMLQEIRINYFGYFTLC